MQILVDFENGGYLYQSVPTGCNVLNSAYPFSVMWFNDMVSSPIRGDKQNYEIAYGFEKNW